MFDFVYRKKRLVQVILALITLQFAFFGVDYYFRGGGSATEVARVGGETISQVEFANAISDQQDRMRQSAGKDYDPTVFSNPEVRYSMLEQLIGQRVLDQQVRRGNLRVSDAQLAQFIGELAPFQEDGKFSRAKYEQLLISQNMTPLAFEQRVRQELTVAPLQEPIANLAKGPWGTLAARLDGDLARWQTRARLWTTALADWRLAGQARS